MNADTLLFMMRAQTLTQTALDALAIAQKLNVAVSAQVAESRGPNAEELALADAVFKAEDDRLSQAIAAAQAEGR